MDIIDHLLILAILIAESHSAYKRLEGVYNRLESVSKSGEQEPENWSLQSINVI